MRPDDAPPLRLDNEPDDIHADGVQLYLRPGRRRARSTGFSSPSPARAAASASRPTSGSAATPAMVTGAWQPTGTGYGLTLGVTLPEWQSARGRRPRLRSAGQRGAAGPAPACGPAGVERWWRVGLPSRRPAGARGLRQCWSSRERVGRGIHLDRQQATRGAVRRPGRRRARARWSAPPAAGCGMRRAASTSTCVMALGAVALGYGHPAVTEAAVRGGAGRRRRPAAAGAGGGAGGGARAAGFPGSSRRDSSRPAPRPWPRRCAWRAPSPGARRCSAAGTTAGSTGVRAAGPPACPPATRALYAELPFNDAERGAGADPRCGRHAGRRGIRAGHARPPDPEWLAVLREETTRVGAVLIADEIKTVGRLAPGGGCERYGIRPDLVVMAKAIANGFPLAAVGGRARGDGRGEPDLDLARPSPPRWVSLAAARATLGVMAVEKVPAHLARVGGRLLAGFDALAGAIRGSCAAWRACRRCAASSSTTSVPAPHSRWRRRGAGSSSSGRPTTSCPSRTTRRRSTRARDAGGRARRGRRRLAHGAVAGEC